MGGALLGGGVEELLDEPQLAVAADERRFEAGRLERAAPAGGDAERLEELSRLLLALQLMGARVLVDDRQLARSGASRRRRAPSRAGLSPGSVLPC